MAGLTLFERAYEMSFGAIEEAPPLAALARPTLADVSGVFIPSVAEGENFVAAYSGQGCFEAQGRFLELTSDGALTLISSDDPCDSMPARRIQDLTASGGYNPFAQETNETTYFWRETSPTQAVTYGSLPEGDLDSRRHVEVGDPGVGPSPATFARSTSGSLVAFSQTNGDVWVAHNGTSKPAILIERASVFDPTHFDIIHLADEIYIYVKLVGSETAPKTIEMVAFEYRSDNNLVAKLKASPIEAIEKTDVRDVALAAFPGGFILFSLHQQGDTMDQNWTMQPYLVDNDIPQARTGLLDRFGQKSSDFENIDLESLSVKALRNGCDLHVVLGAIFDNKINVEGGTFTNIWRQ